MYQETKRYIERKLKKIEYIYTKLPDGYEDIEIRYRKVRDEIGILQNVVSGLTHYEYGGTVMKNVAHWANIVGESTNINAIKREDIYTSTSIVGMQLAQTVSDKSLKEVCTEFSTAYENIAIEKRKMNEKMEDVMDELNSLKKKCKQIDHQRHIVKNIRYDLEELLQSNVYKEDIKNRLEKKLESNGKEIQEQMTDFVHLSMINGIIVKIAKIHKEFCEAAGNHLEKFN